MTAHSRGEKPAFCSIEADWPAFICGVAQRMQNPGQLAAAKDPSNSPKLSVDLRIVFARQTQTRRYSLAWSGQGLYRLLKNWSAANEPSIPWGAPIRVIHLLAPRLLLRRVFPQPV
jgi:hypothetical protein